ncbi:unnamed protein product [Rhizophagus irregularis]|nr:unnamed protein product [Rhizophagus irregularis]
MFWRRWIPAFKNAIIIQYKRCDNHKIDIFLLKCYLFAGRTILSGVSSNFAVLLNYFSLIILDFTGLETDHELTI